MARVRGDLKRAIISQDDVRARDVPVHDPRKETQKARRLTAVKQKDRKYLQYTKGYALAVGYLLEPPPNNATIMHIKLYSLTMSMIWQTLEMADSMQSAAMVIGVSPRTLRRWCERYLEFQRVKPDGRDWVCKPDCRQIYEQLHTREQRYRASVEGWTSEELAEMAEDADEAAEDAAQKGFSVE
jgi:transposase-like protein